MLCAPLEAIPFHLGIYSKVITKATLGILFSTASASVSASLLSVPLLSTLSRHHRSPLTEGFPGTTFSPAALLLRGSFPSPTPPLPHRLSFLHHHLHAHPGASRSPKHIGITTYTLRPSPPNPRLPPIMPRRNSSIPLGPQCHSSLRSSCKT